MAYQGSPSERDLADITLDRLLGSESAVDRDFERPAPTTSKLTWPARVRLALLGETGIADESPDRSWRDYLVEAFIFAAIVVLLAWIGYLTYRAWSVFAIR